MKRRLFLLVGLVMFLIVGSGVLAFESLSLTPRGPPEPLVVAALGTSLDRVDAPSGMAWYLLRVNLTSPQSMTVFPWAFFVSTNQSRVVFSSHAYNVTSLVGGARLFNTTDTIEVSRVRSAEGVLVFLLRVGEGPVTLNYRVPCVDNCGSAIIFSTPVPSVSSIASRFSYNVKMSINGQPVAADGWTVAGANSSTPWTSSMILNGVIENTTNFVVIEKGAQDASDYVVFFTGQTVQVNLWFEYLKKPADPNMIKLELVTNDQGFQVLNMTRLPVSMVGWGYQAGVVMTLKVPPGDHSGSLSFSVQAST